MPGCLSSLSTVNVEGRCIYSILDGVSQRWTWKVG